MTDLYDSEQWHRFDLGHPGGEAMTESLLERSGLIKGSRILDLCCGTGDSVALLNSLGMSAFGVDRDSVILRAQEKHEAISGDSWHCWQGDTGEPLPFDYHYFDAALCECSLSLLKDRATVLAEVRRVLKQEGLFLLSDVCEGEAFQLDGFERLEWRDERQALKNFAIRWIWETGQKFPDSERGKDYFSAVYRAIGPA